MKRLELSLASAAENVALDEALVDAAEAGEAPGEALGFWEGLRIWEAAEPAVILGRSSRIDDEVHRAACAARGVPILRRTSGGATVVIGPGCLMYALVLSYAKRPELRAIDAAHAWVLDRLAGALAPLAPVARRGTSDLALGDRKVSGNSMRCRRDHLVYHGTLLYDFPAELADGLLRMPPRQPDYRARRGHAQFMANLPVGRGALRDALVAAFGASEPLESWPEQRTRRLVEEKYSSPRWNEAGK